MQFILVVHVSCLIQGDFFLPLYTKSFNVHFEVKEKGTFITSATSDYFLKVSVYMEKPEEIEINRHLYILAIHV